MGAFDEPTWDIYREIHKAARWVLCRAMMVAGSADAASDESMDAVQGAVNEVLFVLRGHHDHEREFVDDLVALHAPGLRDEIEVAHLATDEALDRIEELTAGVIAAPVAGRNPLLHRLYLDLSILAAGYLLHLDAEERLVMPALNAAMSKEELMELTEVLRASVVPTDMCRFMQSMLPSMNNLERTDMLTGMSHAPPEIWAQFRSAANQALSTGDFDAATAHLTAV